MDKYIKYLNLSNDFNNNELKNKIFSISNEINNSNLSQQNKLLFLNLLRDIYYDNKKNNNLLNNNLLNNNLLNDIFKFNDNFNNNSNTYSYYSSSQQIINPDKSIDYYYNEKITDNDKTKINNKSYKKLPNGTIINLTNKLK